MKNDLSFFRLFFQVWIHPRKTVQLILDNDPGYCVWRMVVTYAIISTLNPLYFFPLNQFLPASVALLAQVVLGACVGIGFFLLFSWIFYLVGKWIGGTGTYREVRTAYVWGAYPAGFFAATLLMMTQIPNWMKTLNGEMDAAALATQPMAGWQILAFIMSMLFSLWSMVLIVIVIAAAHKIPVWKSVVAFLVMFAVVFILLMAAFLFMARHQIVNRAQVNYEKGEVLFEQKKFKEAMWAYQTVQEFYGKPPTQWLDLAQEKEWTCRAYLNDWIPPQGPMDADMRKLHPDIYEKYKAKLARITPVSQTSSK